MSVNSYKEDEHSTGTSKRNTLKRLFSYLLFYKKKITFVLMIMGFCVVVSLLNPLFMEYAIDNVQYAKLYHLFFLFLSHSLPPLLPDS